MFHLQDIHLYRNYICFLFLCRIVFYNVFYVINSVGNSTGNKFLLSFIYNRSYLSLTLETRDDHPYTFCLNGVIKH